MVGPSFSQRMFPLATQSVPVNTPTVINQSRVVFSGGPGLVWMRWYVTVTNSPGPTATDVVISVVGSAVPEAAVAAVLDEIAGAGLSATMLVEALFRDPADDAFAELSIISQTVGVQLVGNNSAMMAEAWASEFAVGPLVSVV